MKHSHISKVIINILQSTCWSRWKDNRMAHQGFPLEHLGRQTAKMDGLSWFLSDLLPSPLSLILQKPGLSCHLQMYLLNPKLLLQNNFPFLPIITLFPVSCTAVQTLWSPWSKFPNRFHSCRGIWLSLHTCSPAWAFRTPGVVFCLPSDAGPALAWETQ